jgi:DNA polymerase I-like protein with 3'-5' exonuclease and polymerase domains
MSLHLAQEDYLGDKDNFGTKFPKNVKDLIHREHQVMHVLSDMEQTGVRISAKTITELKKFYGDITDKFGKIIKKEAGKEFNPNSWQQKQQEFFGRRGFKPLIYSSNGRGKKLTFSQCVWCKGDGCKICQNTGKSPKCDANFLDSIGIEHSGEGLKPKDALAFAMLHNSAASTMLGFVDQYKEKAVFTEYNDKDERYLILHPNFNQTNVVTTRLSSSQPNLQNVATDESGKKKTDIPYRVREVFIPRPGKAFLAPDYSQIEVWVLALLAGAQEMLKRMAGGEDAHQTVADMVWPGSYDRALVNRAKAKEKKGEKLTEQEAAEKKKASTVRKRIKNINFGIIYGAGDDKVGDAIGVSAKEAKEMKALYFEKFPAVRKFMEHIQASGKANRYVDSPYGIRYYAERGSEYKLTNYIIQGTAAQVLKSGMIASHTLFQESFVGQADILLQIHDELLIECDIPLSEDQKFLRMVEQAMSVDWQFLGSPIQFPIGMKRSTISWGSVKEISV